MPTRNEIESMIFLLEDPDPQVHGPVRQHMVRLGETAVPLIDGIRAGTKNGATAKTLGDILHEITFATLEQEFLLLFDGGLKTVFDLEKGMLLLARVGDPTLRTELYSRRLSSMSRELWMDLHGASSPIDEMRYVLDYMFVKSGFQGPENDDLKPEYSYLNRVMDTKRGIPLSLAMVTLFLSARLEVPFFGVNFPYHFLLGFRLKEQTYYVDPHQAYRLLTRKDCERFLNLQNLPIDEDFFRVTTPAEMLARCMRNLLVAYQSQDDMLRFGHVRILLEHITLYFDLKG